MRRLENKVAVVYGNGSVGCTIAKAFSREGASVFLAGRSLVKQQNGKIEKAQLDALNEQEVNVHMDDVISKAGRIDISF